MKHLQHYKGWELYENGFPTERNFIATRHGVSMNTNSIEGIKRMVDTKFYQMRELRLKALTN